MNPVFEPTEDYNESMSYTDPRGASKFKHYRNHPEVEVTIEDVRFWWAVPVICGALSLIVLAVFRSG